ncbi:LOW QUALITY PROTEIN: hypothetical protein TorRG33x02_348090 [Trema orientale]|uniref:Uncharacterized protein n=1 Tax=Trema orientale TaxID=63057 RepID=A0A2P5AKK5_TREOI|nr:LOW QUALITY PROTEIN: hypothetical protein TorRG33x02_348090 [Trema orientale]
MFRTICIIFIIRDIRNLIVPDNSCLIKSYLSSSDKDLTIVLSFSFSIELSYR